MAADRKRANAAVSRVTGAKQKIDRKLRDLKTTHDRNVMRVKADVGMDVATFTSWIDELGASVRAPSSKKGRREE